MPTSSRTTPSAGVLAVSGADLYYEVRGDGPLVVLHAAPMDAASFTPLAELLATDHTVLTTDPRGINRSRVEDPDRDVTPDDRANDLASLVGHVDLGPAALFGSSGGAVSALALVQAHPGLAHTVISHEPPVAMLLEDRDTVRLETDDIVETYLAGDRRGAWLKFMESADIQLPDGLFEAMFGGPIEGQAAADELFSFVHMERATTFWEPDVTALREADVRLVIGIGDQSLGEMCDRTSRALAALVGVTPTMFPGGHVGYVEEPERFAERLRDVLRAR